MSSKRLSLEQRAEVAPSYPGMTMQQIAEKYRVSKMTVSKIIGKKRKIRIMSERRLKISTKKTTDTLLNWRFAIGFRLLEC